MKTMYINQLSVSTQKAIEEDLKIALSDFNNEDLTEVLDNAMNSKLCDLSDTIDINKYL